MFKPSPVKATPFGRHAVVIALSGPCTGETVCKQLVGAAATAVESDRTGVVIDLRAVSGLGADVLEAIRDIDRTAHRCGWRVIVVKPSSGPLRTLFFSDALDMGLTMASTRAVALMSIMRLRAQARDAA